MPVPNGVIEEGGTGTLIKQKLGVIIPKDIGGGDR